MPSQTGSQEVSTNEDQIITIVLNIFEALDRLGHFEENRIRYAPIPVGHQLDLSLLQQGTIIDDRVLSIMRRLPVPEQTGTRVLITPNQIIVDYSAPEILAWSRDIDSRHGLNALNHRLNTRNALPTDMVLFDMDEAGCGTVILDTKANTIRVFDYNYDWQDAFTQSNASQEEKDRYYSHYRNWPAVPAFDYLQNLLDRLLKAETIPHLVTGGLASTDDINHPSDNAADSRVRELRQKLLRDYEWPGADFREEGWKREGPALIDAAFFPEEID